jgi:integrase
MHEIPSVGEWLSTWLHTRKTLRATTRRSYFTHLHRHLLPHLGSIRLDKLRVGHITAMYDAIEARNTMITARRTSPDPATHRSAKGMRIMKPATMHRLRATLRAALNAAVRQRIIDVNPACHVELPPMRRPKALVWTETRVQEWQNTGRIPSPVMVWTPDQTGAFLDYADHTADRLYALYHLIAYRGLRRGEACGLHWADLDLTARTLTVRWQLTQIGWTTQLEQPKTDSSDAVVAIDSTTVDALHAHRDRQEHDRANAGPGWHDTGLVFTPTHGHHIHPADVTDHFHDLSRLADLPPIRLHDLRHGAATLALAAGVDIKTVQAMLRHSSITITADTYASVLPELASPPPRKQQPSSRATDARAPSTPSGAPNRWWAAVGQCSDQRGRRTRTWSLISRRMSSTVRAMFVVAAMLRNMMAETMCASVAASGGPMRSSRRNTAAIASSVWMVSVRASRWWGSSGSPKTISRRYVRPLSIWVRLHSTTGRMIAITASSALGMLLAAAFPSLMASA